MRILMVSGEYPPDQGGVADYTALLATSLVASGAEVTVLTRLRAKGAVQNELDAEVRVVRAVPKWDARAPRQVRRVAEDTNADIVHFQHQEAAFDMSFAAHLAPAWTARRTGACVAVTYHDLNVPYLFPKAGRLRRWASLLPARSAHLVIATTAADLRDLAGYGVSAHVVPIGSNIAGPPSTFDPADWRARHGFGEGMLLVYFGLLNMSKGLASLVGVLSRLSESGVDARLVVVGSGAGSSDPTNQQSASALGTALETAGVSERVSFTGHVPAPEAGSWLTAADAVLLPYDDGASFRRGSLLAALASGAAIVTTTPRQGAVGPPLPDLAHEDAVLLAAAGDDADLARAVLRLRAEPDLALRLRQRATEVSAAFEWPAIAARHMELYEECLRASARLAPV